MTKEEFDTRPDGTVPVATTPGGHTVQVISVGPQSITVRGCDGHDEAWPITAHSDPLRRLTVAGYRHPWLSRWFNGAND